MKKCNKCGKKGQGNFCMYCGGTMEEVVVEKPIEHGTIYNIKYNIEEFLQRKKVVEAQRTQEKKFSLYCLIATGIFLALGFFKMFVYSHYDGINAYVGGDAYNYIINGTYAAACFVLAGSSFIGSILFEIVDFLKNGK